MIPDKTEVQMDYHIRNQANNLAVFVSRTIYFVTIVVFANATFSIELSKGSWYFLES